MVVSFHFNILGQYIPDIPATHIEGLVVGSRLVF
jgi:hypothetical protein